jgi:hypothetical protein
MSTERNMRKVVVDALRTLHAVSVENGVGVGTPDVNCSLGWIELKSLDDWPARAETPVKFAHFSPEQRLWITKRCQAGGFAWVLLKIAHEWFLLWGETAAVAVDYLTREELGLIAIDVFRGDIARLRDVLAWSVQHAE